MKSLQYLNTHGQTSVPVTDTRPAGVIFDRKYPLTAINKIYNVTTTSLSVEPGIEIIDIIQGATANVRYSVKIIAGGSPLLSSSITFPSLPDGVSLSVNGNTYTLSGIKAVSDWNTIKSFTWNLPSNWSSCPLWFLESSIIYYDEASGQDKTSSWFTYDEDYFWVAQLSAISTVSANIIKAKRSSSSMSASFSVLANAIEVTNATSTLASQFNVSATGYVMFAIIGSNSSLSCSPRVDYDLVKSISSTTSLSCNATALYTDDLRFQIYHDGTRTTFAATVVTYLTNCTVYWGDGTNTSYTSTGTYRTHNISKTYTGSGFKDIKIVSSAVTNFAPTTGSSYCYIYKIYNWSQVPTQGATTYFGSSQFASQIQLTDVPNYIPSNITSMSGTFLNCTSLNDPNISSWNISSITSMANVFEGCTSLDQPVSSWNVSNCSNLTRLFASCTSFNQPIAWTFKNSVYATEMFYGCTNYNQDLSSITIHSTHLDGFLSECNNFSAVNYNKLLIRLANLVFDGGGIWTNATLGVPNLLESSASYGGGHFTTGTDSYNYLVNQKGWTISKDGITIAAGSTSINEGDIASILISFNTSNVSYSSPIIVNLSFTDGTAGPSNYQHTFYQDSGLTTPITSVSFDTLAGSGSQYVYVQTYNDTVTYPPVDKSFIVNVSSSHPKLRSSTNGTITMIGIVP